MQATIPPDAETMPFEESAVLVRPTAAVRHFLLVSRPPIPPGGAPFTVRCLVDRSNGRTTHCQDPAVADPYRAAAIALGSLYQFRLTPAQAAANRRALAVVQPDLSLYCMNPTPAAGTDPGPLLPQFQLSALQLSGWLQAAPTRTNGAMAAGTIFRTTITFRLPRSVPGRPAG